MMRRFRYGLKLLLPNRELPLWLQCGSDHLLLLYI